MNGPVPYNSLQIKTKLTYICSDFCGQFMFFFEENCFALGPWSGLDANDVNVIIHNNIPLQSLSNNRTFAIVVKKFTCILRTQNVAA